MKPLIFALFVVFASGGLIAQTPVWQPSPGHKQMPIWPGASPNAQTLAGPAAGPEEFATVVDSAGNKKLVGDRPWIYVG
jgi:hypothetical protein